MRRLIIPLKILAFAALVLSVIISCAINPVTGKKQIMFMSESQEVELGRSYDPEVIAAFGEYQNDKLLSLAQQIGTDIGKISHRPNIEYHVKLLDSPVVNAFAVPGGYVYLTRGILAQLNNEAELAGIIGHEIGHITARHSVSQQSKQQIGQLLLIGGMIASEEFRQYAEYAMQGMQLLFLGFSRENEREADRLGVEYSSKTGYDAHKMADFFQVLNKMNMASEHAGVPTFLSTHPDPGDRYTAVNQMASEWQQNLNLSDYKVNEDAYLQMINGIVYGDDPRQGYVEGNTFYHPDLKFKFTFPAGWLLENSPLQVRMAPEDGKALMIFTIAAANSLEEAAQTTIEELGLTLEDYNTKSVNGMPALVALSSQTSQDQTTGQQSTIRVLSYFINYGGTYYVFHGVSSAADFNNYAKTLEGTMLNFSQLTEASKLNVRPDRIIVRRVERAGTLASVFKTFGVTQDRMNELALLNNMELNDQVPVGKLIKIIGK